MARGHARACAPAHVVVLTSPGAGHVVPVAELAARLNAHHGVTTTIVTFTSLSSPENSSVLAALPPGVSVANLPAVPLYVCFGSGGTLSSQQTAELAFGLEESGQRFLWVVRFPSDKDSSAAYFGMSGHGEDDDPLSYLPEGFIERTRGKGLVTAQSSPQVEILNHRAVGGFLSHCGWNSSLEAVVAGVPILAWPLFAEQRINAVRMSCEGVGMALRLRASREGHEMVMREEVAVAVRELMVGEKGGMARKNARELRDGAQKAAAPDGPAHRALAAVVDMWKCALG